MQLSARKVEILRNPTTEAAMEFWPWHLLGKPASPDAPMAGLHKARLAWPGSTRQMRAESRRWLVEHGLKPSLNNRSTTP